MAQRTRTPPTSSVSDYAALAGCHHVTSHPQRGRGSLRKDVPTRPPNTGDKLRGARARRDAHGDSSTAEMTAAYHASLLLQRRLVSFIASFDRQASAGPMRGLARTCLPSALRVQGA